MRPQSAKAKGRKFQQQVRDALLAQFREVLHQDDIRSTSMGAAGDDLLLSPLAQVVLPYNFEMKKVENPSLWAAVAQAAERKSPRSVPVAIFSRNLVKLPNAIVAMPAYHFNQLVRRDPHDYDWTGNSAFSLVPLVSPAGFERNRQVLPAYEPGTVHALHDASQQLWTHVIHKTNTFNLWQSWPEYTANGKKTNVAVTVYRDGVEPQTLCSFGDFLRLVHDHWLHSEMRAAWTQRSPPIYVIDTATHEPPFMS